MFKHKTIESMKSALKTLLLCFSAVIIMSSCKKDESYTLTVVANPESAGTVSGGGSYKSGETINLTATPNSGYIFLNWTNNDELLRDVHVSTDANFSYITKSKNETLTANFEQKIIVKMGAQSNTSFGSFYSIGQKLVYTQELASIYQDTIDLLCFYEHVEPSRINDITLSSPGANITGIFTGATSPDVWTTKRLTLFTLPVTAITTAQFDQLHQNDASISTYFNSTLTSGNKKAKTLAVGNIWAFKTQDNIYGLIKVTSVAQNADGYVEFELKLKK